MSASIIYFGFPALWEVNILSYCVERRKPRLRAVKSVSAAAYTATKSRTRALAPVHASLLNATVGECSESTGIKSYLSFLRRQLFGRKREYQITRWPSCLSWGLLSWAAWSPFSTTARKLRYTAERSSQVSSARETAA